MRFIVRLLPLLLAVFFTLSLDFKLSEAPLWRNLVGEGAQSLPRFGFLLSPYHGFWRNAHSELPDLDIPADSLLAPVQVVFDQRNVPHIFAQNDHDLYFTQGYVTAHHRLFQMDLATRQAGGRMAEIIGPKALVSDRFYVRMGFRQAAREAVQDLKKDPTTRIAMEGYTSGINAYIADLKPADFPLEYKLLDAEPAEWTFLRTALLLKSMTWMLTGRSEDLLLTQARVTYGAAAVDSLFPNYAPYQDPVIPPGTRYGIAKDELELPRTPDNPSVDSATFVARPYPQPDKNNGSNNFAVGGKKSATGYPILANDPHLPLNLPSIWYEVHLNAPGINCYGVSLPGAPGVIIGFNDSIAWGVTNVGADVLDWYQIEYRDDKRDEYRHNNKWLKTKKITESIAVRGQEDVQETLVYTHHGPVALEPDEQKAVTNKFFNRVPFGYAMRWVGAAKGNEFMTFYRLNRAENYGQYVAALESYTAPAQNFIFASSGGDIALWANGKYPKKWPAQGKFLLDGRNPAHDWQGWIPHAHNPHVYNPKRGFVSSANQHSTPENYPYYQHWDYATWARGARINERLAEMKNATADSLRALQNDAENLLARKLLPKLLAYVPDSLLQGDARAAHELLAEWDYRHRAASAAATIYQAWWKALEKALWEDDLPPPRYRYPKQDRTIQLILEAPNTPWADRRSTPDTVETVPVLAIQSLNTAVKTLKEELGGAPKTWAWRKYNRAGVFYLLHVDHANLKAGFHPFSRVQLNTDGCGDCVAAIRHDHGPSWRMVVALHPNPDSLRAFGVYPGGQDGNPLSPGYADRIADWTEGQLQRLVFPSKASALQPRATWNFEPAD